jgi:nucleoid DNA-binding protein
MTKTDMIDHISIYGEIPMAKATKIYDGIIDDIASELRANKSATIPGVAKLTVKEVPARAACTKVIAGKSYDLEAKPASKTIKAKVLKALIDQV